MKKPNLTYNQILLLLAASLLAVMVGSVTLGRYPIGLKELGGILVSRIWDMEPFWTKTQEALLLQHRLPRIVLACLVGGSLACAGAAYQGVFQNPMAAPQLIIDIGRVMSAADADMDTLQQQTGIPTVFLCADFDTLPQTYRTLGKLLGRPEKGEELASFCEKVYSRTLSILEQVGDNKVTALYIK